MKRLLVKDPERRPTALGSLSHAWLKKALPCKMLRNWTFEGLKSKTQRVASRSQGPSSPSGTAGAAAAGAAAQLSGSPGKVPPESPSGSDDIEFYLRPSTSRAAIGGQRAHRGGHRPPLGPGGARRFGHSQPGRRPLQRMWDFSSDESDGGQISPHAGPAIRSRPLSAPHPSATSRISGASSRESAPEKGKPSGPSNHNPVQGSASASISQSSSSGGGNGSMFAQASHAAGQADDAQNSSSTEQEPQTQLQVLSCSAPASCSSQRPCCAKGDGRPASAGTFKPPPARSQSMPLSLPPSCKCSNRLVKSSSRCTCPPGCRECKVSNCRQHAAFFGDIGRNSSSNESSRPNSPEHSAGGTHTGEGG